MLHLPNLRWIDVEQLDEQPGEVQYLIGQFPAGGAALMGFSVENILERTGPVGNFPGQQPLCLKLSDPLGEGRLRSGQLVRCGNLQDAPAADHDKTWLAENIFKLIESLIQRWRQQIPFGSLQRAFRILLDDTIQIGNVAPGLFVAGDGVGDVPSVSTLEDNFSGPDPVQEGDMHIGILRDALPLNHVSAFEDEHPGLMACTAGDEGTDAVCTLFPSGMGALGNGLDFCMRIENRLIRSAPAMRTNHVANVMEIRHDFPQ